MSQQEKEALSALLDNESDDLELRRFIKHWQSDSELARTWGRYNLVQSVLQQRGRPLSNEFAEKVQVALADEPAYQLNPSSWRYNLARVAVAAGVALAFFIGIQGSLPGVQAPETAGLPEQAVESPDSLLAADSPAEAVDPVAQQRLFDYIRQVTIDEQETVHSELLQDSPLYRLVNEFQPRNQ